MTNSESQRYHYPVCHTLVTTQHPLSRFQSSARGPGLSPTRSFHGLNVVARASLVENDKCFIRPLDKPDQRPPFSSLPSKQSEAFWLRALPASSYESLSLSLGLEALSKPWGRSCRACLDPFKKDGGVIPKKL